MISSEAQRLSHAYIISSPDIGLREKKALDLSCALLCETPEKAPCMSCVQCKKALAGTNSDLITVSRKSDDKGRQKRELLVDQIRAITADAWVRPQSADRKVYIIADADTMNHAAQNAALKLLEEPPVYAAFILLTSSAEALLPTVRSRCVILDLGGNKERRDSALAREYITLAKKKDKASICAFCSRCEELDSQELTDFFIASNALLCDIISLRENEGISRSFASHLLSLCSLALEYLRMNVNAKHVLGMICVRTVV